MAQSEVARDRVEVICPFCGRDYFVVLNVRWSLANDHAFVRTVEYADDKYNDDGHMCYE